MPKMLENVINWGRAIAEIVFAMINLTAITVVAITLIKKSYLEAGDFLVKYVTAISPVFICYITVIAAEATVKKVWGKDVKSSDLGTTVVKADENKLPISRG